MKMNLLKLNVFSLLGCIFISCSVQQKNINTTKSLVGMGWSSNSVNTVIFRQNAVTTHNNTQFTAYYDADSYLVVAKRTLPNGVWLTSKTQYTGNTTDAHNAISIAVDGAGYLHVSWDHHDNELRYAKSKVPLSLELSDKIKMTGINEQKVSYPQFYNLTKTGGLLFMYRSGQSGRGVLVLNKYDIKTKKWTQLYQNLIDGENYRNAYWQAYVDLDGNIHLSWVWRETYDVATNHDIAYAKSTDDGVTWQKSTGEKYQLPITQSSAEYSWKIPQNSSLINQTAMTTDNQGNPYIASYWNDGGKTQYQIVYSINQTWKRENTAFRSTGFELGGGGTKKIPISRPEIFISNESGEKITYLLFRDASRGNKISLAYKNLDKESSWEIRDLTEKSVGDWEPNFDKELFKKTGKVHIFEQEVVQIDGEGLKIRNATPVGINELKKLPYKSQL